MLPATARQWSDEQLRSVLLHELAHIKRRDTVVQLLAQIACALHWFNPLVWFAAWRLGLVYKPLTISLTVHDAPATAAPKTEKSK